jgi:capsule polysaccharide modification protein KpsS
MDDRALKMKDAIVTDAGDIRDWFQLPQLARVVTVNSSAGFEALLYGIPTVTLGRNWYTSMTRLSESYLPTFMNSAIAPCDPDRSVWSAAVYHLARGIEQKKFFLSGADFGRHLNTVL